MNDHNESSISEAICASLRHCLTGISTLIDSGTKLAWCKEMVSQLHMSQAHQQQST
jgi:hypothetical protein